MAPLGPLPPQMGRFSTNVLILTLRARGASVVAARLAFVHSEEAARAGNTAGMKAAFGLEAARGAGKACGLALGGVGVAGGAGKTADVTRTRSEWRDGTHGTRSAGAAV